MISSLTRALSYNSEHGWHCSQHHRLRPTLYAMSLMSYRADLILDILNLHSDSFLHAFCINGSHLHSYICLGCAHKCSKALMAVTKFSVGFKVENFVVCFENDLTSLMVMECWLTSQWGGWGLVSARQTFGRWLKTHWRKWIQFHLCLQRPKPLLVCIRFRPLRICNVRGHGALDH